jgi:hypothetical protein
MCCGRNERTALADAANLAPYLFGPFFTQFVEDSKET